MAEDEGNGQKEWIQFFKKNGLLYTYNTKHGTIQRMGTLKDALAEIEKGMKRRNAK